ncbi:MAG TPA: hypothetical protein VL285_00385 [Bryobacteraceae bacterium]|nr:hypothetical protein [Bryobacteraceae bacterium]
MKRNLILAALPLAAAVSLPAASIPTYSKDVAPIIHNRCAQCHRPGEAAPMPLLSYKQVRPWAAAIREKVLSRAMPPWLADPHYGKFANDRRMPQSEIDTIAAWAGSGAPEGRPRDLPELPEFVEGWSIGKPDAVVSLLEEVDVPAEGVVPYKYYKVPSNFTEDKWVEAAEIRAGNRSLVHHVIVFIQEPDGAPKPADNGVKDNLLVGFAPGEQPKIYPPGTAKLVKAGSTFLFQMHYTPNGKAGKDKTYVGLRFARTPVTHRALTGRALTNNFAIPPGDSNYEVKSSWTAKEDTRIRSFMPHMHLRGKDFQYTAVYPDGRSEVVLSVPKYYFNWQLVYELKEPLFLPKGSRLDCVAHFDNSANNKFNPDPTRTVRWGDQTWEEMMIGWFDLTLDSQNLMSQR